MSAARTIYILVFLAALLVLAAFIGCDILEPDRSGTAVENQPPEVFIVNIPPDSAVFSRNPDLNWYATDIDGYIRFFRYAVVVESMMVINGAPVPPDVFIQQGTDAQFGWDTLRVDLDHPQSSATIRLYANVDFPVDSFVSQFFFIQACDDQGALSSVKYRKYSRNNHYPNTRFRARDFYINAKDPSSPAPGINLDWRGADSIDWGRAEAPLEYEWRLYGPFDTTAAIYIKLVPENCIYDPTLDSLIGCIDVPVLDVDNLPPAIGGTPQPLQHSRGPNYANDPNDVWVTDNRTTLYNVFEGMNLTQTSKYRFIFWVRARDDGFVPDPTPAFQQFFVFEALFERPIAVFDETGYTRQQGRWAAESLHTSMRAVEDLVRAAGYDESQYETWVDYFFKTNYPCDRCPAFNQSADTIRDRQNPDLIDVLSHRILLFYADDVDGEINENPGFGFMYLVFQGIDMGASGFVMARNLGGVNQNYFRNQPIAKSLQFQEKFGISQVNCEAWFHDLVVDIYNPVFNEEFIGAYPNIGGYPQIDVDVGVGGRLDTLYKRMPLDTSHVMVGLPEVGVGTRTQFAAPIYLYLSKDGDKSIFHGKVNAVVQQNGDLRSACFLFTPTAMVQEPMKEVFTTITNWLEAKFIEAPAALKGVPSYNTSGASVAERRMRLDRSLDYLAEYAKPEYLESIGLVLPPFQISPDSDTK